MQMEYLTLVIARREMEDYLALDGRARPERASSPARTRRATASLLRRIANAVDPGLASGAHGTHGA
jgi:hypothetical protein